jgi:hypothetical protein
LEFSEVRGSNLPPHSPVQRRIGHHNPPAHSDRTRGWLRSWRGFVTSCCDLLLSNFLRISPKTSASGSSWFIVDSLLVDYDGSHSFSRERRVKAKGRDKPSSSAVLRTGPTGGTVGESTAEGAGAWSGNRATRSSLSHLPCDVLQQSNEPPGVRGLSWRLRRTRRSVEWHPHPHAGHPQG